MHDPLTQSLSIVLKEHITLRWTRQETLLSLTILILRFGTVSLWRLAAHAQSRAKTLSVHRRFERFFQRVTLDKEQIARLIVQMMGLSGKPWRLAIDRTNWKFGTVHINILMLGILHEGLCIPLFWTSLGKAGNSNADARINLLQTLRHIFPDQEIECVIGDREFIGPRWMGWLHQNDIPFILRVRENIHAWYKDQNAQKLSSKAKRLHKRRKMILPGQWYLGPGCVPVDIVMMRLKTGELIALAVNGLSPKRALKLYKQRWGIETLFSCFKKRGLNLEATHMSNPHKISTLIAILSIGFCIAFKTGLWAKKYDPPRMKKHGAPQLSIFTLGLNTLRKILATMNTIQIIQCLTTLLSEKIPLKQPLTNTYRKGVG